MDQFDVLQTLGRGSFGVVRKVRRRCDDKTLVVKEMYYGKADDKQKQQIVAEVGILTVCVFGNGDEKEGRKIRITEPVIQLSCDTYILYFSHFFPRG